MTDLPTIGSLIGGRWAEVGREVRDLDPSQPDRAVAIALHADPSMVVEAVLAAREASTAWAATAAPARGDILRRAADLIEGRSQSIAHDLAAEEGKTIGEATGEVGRAVAILRYYAGQCLEPDGETYPSVRTDTWVLARRVPIGVVAVITPWNFPIAIPAWKIAPALAYGNAVVWKPADLVPLTAVHLARALSEAGLPDGVLSLVLGSGQGVGPALVDHPAVDAVSFTGSNDVGRTIAAAGAARSAKVQLELGGKNPSIVLADADLEVATQSIANAAFLSAGQKCTATSRVIVERSVMNEVKERLVSVARGMRVGDPLHPSTVIGPLASEAQLLRVRGYLEIARADGATFLTDGDDGIPPVGFFQAPVILDGLSSESRVTREEVFGPVVTLAEAVDAEDALRQANDSQFGLTASVYTRSLRTAAMFAERLRVGIVKVNQDSTGVEPQVPFGGMGGSSMGSREQGRAAREFYTQWKSIYAQWG